MTTACEQLETLRAARLKIISGGGEAQIRFGDEEVRYHKADIGRLDREITRLEVECNGGAGGHGRVRFAKRAVFGRY
jgi:hypothetical protein